MAQIMLIKHKTAIYIRFFRIFAHQTKTFYYIKHSFAPRSPRRTNNRPT